MTVLAIAMSLNQAGEAIAIAGTESGVYLSRNGGQSWHDLAFPDLDDPVVTVAISPEFASDGLMFAGTEGAGLFRSRDGGATWSRMLPDDAAVEAVSVQFTTGTDVLAIMADSVFVSGDAGDTWQERPVNLPPGQFIVTASPIDYSGSQPHVLIGLADGTILNIAP
jgi:photosystem II stability/assembly factor-like uncharacterized protein